MTTIQQLWSIYLIAWTVLVATTLVVSATEEYQSYLFNQMAMHIVKRAWAVMIGVTVVGATVFVVLALAGLS